MMPMLPKPDRLLECVYLALAGFVVIAYVVVVIGLHFGSGAATGLIEFLGGYR